MAPWNFFKLFSFLLFLKVGNIQVILSLFFLIGFTTCKTKHPLRGMKLQEREEGKIKEYKRDD